MVNLTINGIPVSVKEGTTILEAARSAQVHIPTLCYLKDINEIGACRVCVVEVEGSAKLVTACNNKVWDGMVIHTNSPKVRESRRNNVELILSQHDCQCPTCVRSGNCSLQSLANNLGILQLPFKQQLPKSRWPMEFPLIRDARKCIKCMRCVQICDKITGLNIWDVAGTGKLRIPTARSAASVSPTVRWGRSGSGTMCSVLSTRWQTRKKSRWFR